MKILSLLPPKLKEAEIQAWKAKIHNSKEVLGLLESQVNKQINEINRILDNPEKYDKPGYDRYISGLLRSRAELLRFRDYVVMNEVKHER